MTEEKELTNYKKILSQKIDEKLYELKGMDSDYREGQRSVFLWVQRELRRT